MGEFDLIDRFFRPLQDRVPASELLLGIGDDVAVTRVPPGHDLAFSIDALIEGVHFPASMSSCDLGWRALAVSASDLAAAGATPGCFTLALTLPEADEHWLAGFTEGLGAAMEVFGLTLVGGNMARGPLQVVMQVHGYVPAGQVLTRGGARPGDLVCVSGSLGDAGAGLRLWGTDLQDEGARALTTRFARPTPRLALGMALRGLASAAIDISDGFLADLGRVLAASGVGATLDVELLPLSDALRACFPEEAVSLALSAGDDYELCFTVPVGQRHQLAALPGSVTVLGVIEAAAGLRWRGAAPGVLSGGFDHFQKARG